MTVIDLLSRITESVTGRVRGYTAPTIHDSQWSVTDEIDRQTDLYIYHHLGLGDMIHCNGMVRYLLDEMESSCRVHVFCKSRYLEMAQWMYRDEPRIVLVEVPTGQREQTVVNAILRKSGSRNYLSVGHRPMRRLEREFPKEFCDMLFYRQVGIPYRVRYSHCYWERDFIEEERVFKKLVGSNPYVFVHDDPSRGFHIDSSHFELPVVRNDITESIFALAKVLENAAEVHCMESSIRCMVESLDMQNTALYYHNFRYTHLPLGEATSQTWKEIHYENGQPI